MARFSDVAEMPLFKRLRQDPTQAFLGNARSLQTEDGHDPFLAELLKAQAFNARPELVTAGRLDALVAAGERELWRGFESRAALRAFRTGARFAGTAGTWVAYASDFQPPELNGAALALHFTPDVDPKLVLRMCLVPDAEVRTWLDIRASAKRDAEAIAEQTEDPNTVDEVDSLIARLAVYKEPICWAVCRGIDAVDQENGEMLILNRGALLVQSTAPIIADEIVAVAGRLTPSLRSSH